MIPNAARALMTTDIGSGCLNSLSSKIKRAGDWAEKRG